MKTMELIFIALMLFSCNSDDQPTTVKENEIERENFAEFISPAETDSEIDVINDNFHYAIFNELENERGDLLIFLGGTMSRTTGTTIFSEFTANRGFHVINLAYPNLTPVRVCSDEIDEDCALKYRKEIFEGIEGSDFVSVDANNSIENRIQKLLLYLVEIDPQGKWEQYLNINQIVWNKILIAGHSQGAGHAAFIGKQKNVKRALMFAGPNDFSDFYNAPSNWLASNSQTPLENKFVFLHLRDEAAGFETQEQCLIDMGFSSLFNVDNSSSPYLMNNALFTDAEPDNQGAFGAPFHGSVVNDRFTPFANGQPLHSEVWEHMLGIE